MRLALGLLLAGCVHQLCAASDVVRSHEQLWTEHERREQKQFHTALSATMPTVGSAITTANEIQQQHGINRRTASALASANPVKMSTRETCFRACSLGSRGEWWGWNTELTPKSPCMHMIQAQQLKMATLEGMEFNGKGTGLLPIEYGAWDRSWNDKSIKPHQSFMPSDTWLEGITWDTVIDSQSVAATEGASPSQQPQNSPPWSPGRCVMGTHFGGSDGLGMNIERAMIGNVIGLLLGCRVKCAPILSRIRHSVVYAHHADGTTTYCHHAGYAQNKTNNKAEKTLEMEAIDRYTKRFAFHKNQKSKGKKHDDGTLPAFWLENMRCHNITHFQNQLSNIVPCWSADIATGLPNATIFDPPTLEGKHYVLTKLFEIPRSLQNLVTWNERVAEARALIMNARERATRKSKTKCTFARSPPSPPFAADPTAAKMLTIAVHIRNGDVVGDVGARAITRLELCLVRRVCGVLHSNGFRTQVHVYSETSRVIPTASGTFPEFGNMLIFEPYPNGTGTPPWCGGGGNHHSLARLRGLPGIADKNNYVNNGGNDEDKFSSALGGVRVTLNGNPLDDMVCMADAAILVSGMHSSFSGVSTTLSSGIKLRFPSKNYRKSGRELRQMLWQLIPEDVHLEYDYSEECYDSNTGKLSDTCGGGNANWGNEDWGTCPPMHFDEASFVQEVTQRHI